jgi:hypothetical protein
MSPGKQVFVYREIYRHRVQDSEQALLIAAACRDDVPESIVAGRDLWNSSGKGVLGRSTAETYQLEWQATGFHTRLFPPM